MSILSITKSLYESNLINPISELKNTLDESLKTIFSKLRADSSILNDLIIMNSVNPKNICFMEYINCTNAVCDQLIDKLELEEGLKDYSDYIVGEIFNSGLGEKLFDKLKVK